ncbi:MAG: ABC transporter permease, partial [Acidobacteria bacterium]|nr:ABC transporter permease [Acidobacteriota bacterium]
QALAPFPLLQRIVLINPLVYASEGFRGALVPHVPHLSMPAVTGSLIGFDTIFVTIGLRQFRKKALG